MIVLWRITDRCNFGCGFCAYDRSLPFARSDVLADEVARFGSLLGRWAKHRGETILLSWLGGEPFLWKPLLELSAKFSQDTGIRLSATTNGSTLHRPDIRSTILDHFAELTISVDGFADRHDDVRKAPGSWDRIAAGVQALAGARTALKCPLRLRVNIVLMRGSIDDFQALCLTLADWGVDEITFNQLGGRDRPEFYPANRLLPDEVVRLRDLLPELAAMLAKRQVRLCAHNDYLDRISATTLGQPLPFADCGPAETFLFIDENCIIAPCSFTIGDYGIPTHSITTAADLAQLPAKMQQARRLQRSKECDDCPSTQTFQKFAA